MLLISVEVNNSRHKQCGVIPLFSHGVNSTEKILKKGKYWQKSIEKNFLMDPLTTKDFFLSQQNKICLQVHFIRSQDTITGN